MSDPLALPNDEAQKGGLLAAEGGYHYVSETESGGRWGEEEGGGVYGTEESGGNRRGTAGFVVRDRTVYLVGWLPSRSKTLVFLGEFMSFVKVRHGFLANPVD